MDSLWAAGYAGLATSLSEDMAQSDEMEWSPGRVEMWTKAGLTAIDFSGFPYLSWQWAQAMQAAFK